MIMHPKVHKTNKAHKARYITTLLATLIIASWLRIWSSTHAQSNAQEFAAAPTDEECPVVTGRILWPDQVKINTTVEYTFALEETSLIPGISNVTVGISGQQLTTPGNKLTHNFTEVGEYTLISTFEVEECDYQVSKTIHAYDQIYTYIGRRLDQYRLEYDSIYHDNGILLKSLPLDDEGLLNKQVISTTLLENIYYLRHSDVIIIQTSNFLDIFDVLRTLVNDIRFEQKQIYVITSANQNLAKRLISFAIQGLQNPRTYVVQESFAPFFLWQANDLEAVNNQAFVTLFSVEFTQINPLQFGSYLFNYLIFNGIPVSVLSLIMSISLALVVLVFLRQVIGMNTYGMITPILFALSLHILGTSLSVMLFVLWLVSAVLTQLIIKNIHLHYQAKLSIYASLYLIIMLVVFWRDHVTGRNFISLSVFQNPLSVFTLLFFILKMRGFFYDDATLFSKRLWKEIIEFLVIALILLFIIERRGLQYQLLIYPELLIAFFLASLGLGRYTGLQVTEMIRFRGLLFGYDEDDQEE